MNIDQLLPVSPEFQKLYIDKVNAGIEHAKTLDIVFIGLARNVDSTISLSLPYLLEMPIFKSVELVVFENDSTDNTKQILSSLQTKFSNLHYLTEDYSAPHLPLSKSTERTEALAKYRNICQSYIKTYLSIKDYVIVLDLDFIDISFNGILNTFGWLVDKNIDAICGNSYQLKHIFSKETKTLWNYDSWAFRGNWWIDKQTEIKDYDPMLWFGFWIPPIGSPLIKINSGFGGMATYKYSYFFKSNYEGYDCEHVCFHKNLANISDFQLFLNPSQAMLFI